MPKDQREAQMTGSHGRQNSGGTPCLQESAKAEYPKRAKRSRQPAPGAHAVVAKSQAKPVATQQALAPQQP